MKHVIDTGLARVSAPFSWATVGNGVLFTAQVPFDEAGKLVGDDIREQTAQCLRNLTQTVTRAGATMVDVTQVVVFLTRPEDVAGMNEVYPRFFQTPYPNRATVIVAGLTVASMRVEMLAYAALDGRGRAVAKRTAPASARPRRPPSARPRRAGRRASR